MVQGAHKLALAKPMGVQKKGKKMQLSFIVFIRLSLLEVGTYLLFHSKHFLMYLCCVIKVINCGLKQKREGGRH